MSKVNKGIFVKYVVIYILIAIAIIVGGDYLGRLSSLPDDQPVRVEVEYYEWADTAAIIAENKAKLQPEIFFVERTIPAKIDRDSLKNWMRATLKDSLLATGEYVAEADTTFEKELTLSKLKATIRFRSLVPLHPDSYFEIETVEEIKRITHHLETMTTVFEPERKTWFERLKDRFQISLNTSAGIGLIHKQFDIYIGIGGSFNL